MKLLMKRAFTVVLAAVLLFGCGEDDNKTGGNELTPQENKAKLEQCAMEVLGKINPQDHKTLVETIMRLPIKPIMACLKMKSGRLRVKVSNLIRWE